MVITDVTSMMVLVFFGVCIVFTGCMFFIIVRETCCFFICSTKNPVTDSSCQTDIPKWAIVVNPAATGVESDDISIVSVV